MLPEEQRDLRLVRGLGDTSAARHLFRPNLDVLVIPEELDPARLRDVALHRSPLNAG